ncbi:MAG: hypothetical protein H6656_02140 [Ardenticatenaceae bacterium]|nr:hypothetical protein [Ardenticatenaceae bacterium]
MDHKRHQLILTLAASAQCAKAKHHNHKEAKPHRGIPKSYRQYNLWVGKKICQKPENRCIHGKNQTRTTIDKPGGNGNWQEIKNGGGNGWARKIVKQRNQQHQKDANRNQRNSR